MASSNCKKMVIPLELWAGIVGVAVIMRVCGAGRNEQRDEVLEISFRSVRGCFDFA